MSLPVSKTKQLNEEKGTPASAALVKLRENVDRPVSAIVILNNIVNIVGSIQVGTLAAVALGDAWLGAFSALLTMAIIVFSEIIPKTVGVQHNTTIGLLVARPLLAVAFVMTPMLWASEKITSLFRKEGETTTNEAEIRFLVQAGSVEDVIEDDEEEMILNVFKLNDIPASKIMTPRIAMTYVYANATLDEQREVICGSQHSRLVVIDTIPDEVVGVALRQDLLVALVEGKGHLNVAEYTRDVMFVPHTMKADDLLTHFRKSRQHLSVVTGPYGGVAGVLTIEDVIEVVTGEIVDETDQVEDMQTVAATLGKPRLEAALIVAGATRI